MAATAVLWAYSCPHFQLGCVCWDHLDEQISTILTPLLLSKQLGTWAPVHVCHQFNFHVIVGPFQGLLSFLSLETFRPCSYGCCLLSGIDCQVLGKVGFNFPIALSLIHYVVSWVIMAILKSVSLLPAAPLSKATPLSTVVALSIVMAFSTGLANVSLKYNRYKILSLTSHLIWNHSPDLSMSKHKGDWLPTNKRRLRSNELGCLSNRNLNFVCWVFKCGFLPDGKDCSYTHHSTCWVPCTWTTSFIQQGIQFQTFLVA